MAVAADAAAPFRLAAVIKSGVESDVFDELLGVGEALDVADKSPRAKATISRMPHKRTMESSLRFGEHLLSDEAAPVLALLVGVAQFRQEDFDHWQHRALDRQ